MVVELVLRCMVGSYDGFLIVLGAPAYIGEMSPPSIRGVLISLKEAAIVLGILLGYLIGFLFSPVDGGWAYTFGLAMIFAAVMFAGSYFLLVESTRFLYLKGKFSQAKESMDWILKPEASERAFNEMGVALFLIDLTSTS